MWLHCILGSLGYCHFSSASFFVPSGFLNVESPSVIKTTSQERHFWLLLTSVNVLNPLQASTGVHIIMLCRQTGVQTRRTLICGSELKSQKYQAGLSYLMDWLRRKGWDDPAKISYHDPWSESHFSLQIELKSHDQLCILLPGYKACDFCSRIKAQLTNPYESLYPCHFDASFRMLVCSLLFLSTLLSAVVMILHVIQLLPQWVAHLEDSGGLDGILGNLGVMPHEPVLHQLQVLIGVAPSSHSRISWMTCRDTYKSDLANPACKWETGDGISV